MNPPALVAGVLAQAAAGADSASLVPVVITSVVSVVVALCSGALVKAGVDVFLRRANQRKIEAEAERTGDEGTKARAEAAKLVAEGEVAESAELRAWVAVFEKAAADAHAEARAAKVDAGHAEQSAREARADAEACARDRDADRSEIDSLRATVERLERLVGGCTVPACPVVDRLTAP